jgi:selenide, water dikinase
VTDIDLENNTIHTNDPTFPTVPYTATSLDIGSRTRNAVVTPGVSDFAIPTRPISMLVKRIAAAEEVLKAASSSPQDVVIVGGGAAGIELSLAMRARWTKAFPGALFNVTLLDHGEKLLPHEAPACQKCTNDALAERNITVLHGCAVKEITASAVHIEDGRTVTACHVIWATGAMSHPLAQTMAGRGLACDDRGWVRVNPNLQSLSHPNVFAAGDCCSVEDPRAAMKPPKAGVYAVRSGPILIQNLSRFLDGKELIEYRPQDDFLKLLMHGDETAHGFRFGLGLKGAWVWKMKDHIDRMFMDLFKEDNLPDLSGSKELDTSQFDSGDVINVDDVGIDEAARELMRIDGDVNYMRNWGILRKMIGNDEFKSSVIAAIEASRE